MRRVLRAIKGFFRTGKSPGAPSIDAAAGAMHTAALHKAPGLAPDWGPEEMVALNGFLGSPAGKVLLARGRAIQFENQTAACKDVFHTQHSAGSAKGFGEALDWIESLSRACRVEQDSGPENEGQTDAPSPGEAAWRDSMSP